MLVFRWSLLGTTCSAQGCPGGTIHKGLLFFVFAPGASGQVMQLLFRSLPHFLNPPTVSTLYSFVRSFIRSFVPSFVRLFVHLVGLTCRHVCCDSGAAKSRSGKCPKNMRVPRFQFYFTICCSTNVLLPNIRRDLCCLHGKPLRSGMPSRSPDMHGSMSHAHGLQFASLASHPHFEEIMHGFCGDLYFHWGLRSQPFFLAAAMVAASCS